MASGVLALVVMEENMEKSETDAELKDLHFIGLKIRENLTILLGLGGRGLVSGFAEIRCYQN